MSSNRLQTLHTFLKRTVIGTNCLLAFMMTILFVLSCGPSNEAQEKYKIIPPSSDESYKAAIEGDRMRKKLKELNVIENYEEGLDYAKRNNKPILLIFTGYGAIYSSRLEHEVITGNKDVFNKMKDDYINVWLYVDSKKQIDETYTDFQRFATLGEKWTALQKDKFAGDFLPHIFILNPEGKIIKGGFNFHDVKSDFLQILNNPK